MAPPIFQRARPSTNTAEMLRRVEDNVASYAAALTGERGLLRSNLPYRDSVRGRHLILPEVEAPDDWVIGTLGAGWDNLGGATDPRTSYRKTHDGGRIEVRGRASYMPGVPVTQAPIMVVPTGLEPLDREVFDCYATVGAAYTPAVLTCHTGALRWITGGYNNLSFSGDVFWTPANRSPPEWPLASQVVLRLGPDYPGEPGLVRVDDAVTASGLHLGGFSALWSAVKDGRQWVLTIRNVLGLPPGGPYTLNVAVISA